MDAANNPIELSIIMPCLNEARTIGTCIRKAKEFCQKEGVSYEIIVGDNGSTDGSVCLSEAAGARVVVIHAKGYGNAVRGAVLASQGRHVIMGDSDDSYDFSDLSAFLAKLREGYELVIGNRWHGGIQRGALPWKNKWIGNPVLSTLGRIFFGVKCGDFHCGLRGFSRKAFDRMDLCTPGMEFATEMLFRAKLAGLCLTEVPIKLFPHGRETRSSHLRPWRDGWRHLSFMLLHSPRWLFTVPGFALMAFGITLGILIWAGKLPLDNPSFEIGSVLLCGVLTVLGYQLLLFSFASQVHGMDHGMLLLSDPMKALMKKFTMERGLLIGLGIFSVGATLMSVIGAQWRQSGLGTLDPASALRMAIPGILCLVMGCQTILASFHVGILKLNRREQS